MDERLWSEVVATGEAAPAVPPSSPEDNSPLSGEEVMLSTDSFCISRVAGGWGMSDDAQRTLVYGMRVSPLSGCEVGEEADEERGGSR